MVVTACPPPSGTRVSWHHIWESLSSSLSGLSDGSSVLQISTLVFKFLSGSWERSVSERNPKGLLGLSKAGVAFQGFRRARVLNRVGRLGRVQGHRSQGRKTPTLPPGGCPLDVVQLRWEDTPSSL